MSKELTLQEIQAQIQELTAKAAVLKSEKKAEVIERMREEIALYEITAGDLGLVASEPRKVVLRGSKKGSSVAAMYRNPKDQNQTWSGRGRAPQWVVSYEAEHGEGKRADLLIKD